MKDVVWALTWLMELPAARGQIFNVASDEEVAIRDLAERVIALTGSASEIRFVPFADAYGSDFEDMQRRVPDLTKIREAIGCWPRYDSDAIIRDVVTYYEGTVRTARSPAAGGAPLR